MKHTREQIAEKVIQQAKAAYPDAGIITQDSPIVDMGDTWEDDEFINSLWREFPEILKEVERRHEPSFGHKVIFGKPGTIAACIDLIYNSPANK